MDHKIYRALTPYDQLDFRGKFEITRDQQSKWAESHRDNQSGPEKVVGVEVSISEEARINFFADRSDQNGSSDERSDEEKREVRELKQRDREVRAHEQAHVAAAGDLVRKGASYEYKTGPDGQRYAVSGEVSIDTSEVEGDPDATLRKAERIRRAALAPADPSSQDYRVASEASAMAAKARQDISQEQNEGLNESNNSSNTDMAFQSLEYLPLQIIQLAYNEYSEIGASPQGQYGKSLNIYF